MPDSATVAADAPRQCPECGDTIQPTGEEAVCEGCGLVVAEHAIDHGPDWRNFADDSGDPRRAAPVSSVQHDRALGTGQPDRLTATKSAAKIADTTAVDKQTIYVRAELLRITDQLDWTRSHQERGADIIRDLYRDGDLIGYDADTVVAAICWLVNRVFHMGHSPDDIRAHARDVERDAMLRRAQWVKRQLDLPVPVADYATRVRRVAAEIDTIDHETTERAVQRVNSLDGTVLSGARPSALAATALYIESDVTQETLADAADVSPPSIRNQYDRFGFDGGEYHG